MKKLIATVAIATLAMTAAAFAAPIVEGPMSLGTAVYKNAIDVAFNGYSIKGINVIERQTNGTVVVKVSTTTGPVLLSIRSGQTVDRDGNPCYAKFGAFHKLVNGKTCVYDPDMYVSQQSWSAPKTVVNDVTKNATFISTKTTTHEGNNPLKNYYITEVNTTVVH